MTMTVRDAFIFLCLIQSSLAIPTILLESPKAKCIQVEAAQDTAIRVEYEAPDIVIDKSKENYGPTFITINLNPTGRVTDTDLHHAPVKSKLKNTSEVLKEQKGTVKHRFEFDGVASVCIRSSTAGPRHVQRFGIRIADDQSKPIAEDADPDKHLSHMEVEMTRILTGMTAMIKQAEFAEEREEAFRLQSENMHAATMWWPVVQVCVLIMTGFTQASHITRFFKSRRII